MSFDINYAIKHLKKRRKKLSKRLAVVNDFLDWLEDLKRQEEYKK